MPTHARYLPAILLCLTVLASSCTSSPPEPGTGNNQPAQPHSSGSSTPDMLTVLPGSTSTAITEVVKLDVSGPLTFEEIDQEWKRILQEYGDDIHRPSEEFRLFSRALLGKKVEGWTGWIADVFPV